MACSCIRPFFRSFQIYKTEKRKEKKKEGEEKGVQPGGGKPSSGPPTAAGTPAGTPAPECTLLPHASAVLVEARPSMALASAEAPAVAHAMFPTIPSASPGRQHLAALGAAPPAPIPEAAPAAAPARPMPSDDEIVRRAAALGADEPALRAILATPIPPSNTYLGPMLRVLALAGPQGASINEAALRARDEGLAAWDPDSTTVKSGLRRMTDKDTIAFQGKSRYALKVFPGIQEVPRPEKKGGGSAGGAGKSKGKGKDAAAGAATGATNHEELAAQVFATMQVQQSVQGVQGVAATAATDAEQRGSAPGGTVQTAP
jgi:hypothetical protein